jgi:hypothetical protein
MSARGCWRAGYAGLSSGSMPRGRSRARSRSISPLSSRHCSATTALGRVTGGQAPPRERLRLDRGEALLAAEFDCITRHDFASELFIPDPQPVEDYVRSMTITFGLPDPQAFAALVTSLIPASETFRVRTHTGCLVCR